MSSFPYKTKLRNPTKPKATKAPQEEGGVSFEGMFWVLGGPRRPAQACWLCRNGHRPCPLRQRGKQRGQAARLGIGEFISLLTGQWALVGSRKRKKTPWVLGFSCLFPAA